MKLKLPLALYAYLFLPVFLLGLELGARTEDSVRYGAPFLSNYSLDRLFAFDSVGRHGLPNTNYTKFHLNEVGSRGPALRAGTYRIACVGSSETFGLYESPEKEWPRQLEATLNKRAGSDVYEAVNVANPGMTLWMSLKRLPQMLSVVHPQMAVIYPTYTPYITMRPPPPPVPHFLFRSQAKLMSVGNAVTPDIVKYWILSWQQRGDAHNDRLLERIPPQNVEAFRADLDKMTAELLSHGVRVVLVTHANRFGRDVQPGDRMQFADWHKFYPAMRKEGMLAMEAKMSDVVRQVGAARGVPVVDAASEIEPGKTNFADFVHFTDAGAERMAKLVADEVEREAPLSASRN